MTSGSKKNLGVCFVYVQFGVGLPIDHELVAMKHQKCE